MKFKRDQRKKQILRRETELGERKMRVLAQRGNRKDKARKMEFQEETQRQKNKGGVGVASKERQKKGRLNNKYN